MTAARWVSDACRIEPRSPPARVSSITKLAGRLKLYVSRPRHGCDRFRPPVGEHVGLTDTVGYPQEARVERGMLDVVDDSTAGSWPKSERPMITSLDDVRAKMEA